MEVVEAVEGLRIVEAGGDKSLTRPARSGRIFVHRPAAIGGVCASAIDGRGGSILGRCVDVGRRAGRQMVGARWLLGAARSRQAQTTLYTVLIPPAATLEDSLHGNDASVHFHGPRSVRPE